MRQVSLVKFREFSKTALGQHFHSLFMFVVEALELKSKQLSEVEALKDDAVTNHVSLCKVHN